MRLATRALIVALATLVLCAVVSAQRLRDPNDPKNQSPAVGTGGTEGGPTGLFTLYDGDTIRRGEFTFSIAYSNFDRDPGNVDLVEVPLSFNIGLNDHMELFFKTTAYRGLHVNNPQNLSSFYLPNSQLFYGTTLCTGRAIILEPIRVSGTNLVPNGSGIYRPRGAPCDIGGQPFVQFPFVGGGNFSGASFFPGIGSPVGSILPGIVLTTRTIPANLTFNTLTVPDLATIQPAYLPDAPFINRLYGESTWTQFTVGAKIRFTDPNSGLGAGIIPFYRWYTDRANGFSGFNEMQRGAGPGSSIGDFGI